MEVSVLQVETGIQAGATKRCLRIEWFDIVNDGTKMYSFRADTSRISLEPVGSLGTVKILDKKHF